MSLNQNDSHQRSAHCISWLDLLQSSASEPQNSDAQICRLVSEQTSWDQLSGGLSHSAQIQGILTLGPLWEARGREEKGLTIMGTIGSSRCPSTQSSMAIMLLLWGTGMCRKNSASIWIFSSDRLNFNEDSLASTLCLHYEKTPVKTAKTHTH